MVLYLCQNLLCEELVYGFGGDRMEVIVNRHAYAALALTHAESTAKLYLIPDIVLRDQILKLFHHLAGTLDMTGTADANCNFKHNDLPHNIHQNLLIDARENLASIAGSDLLLLIIDNANPAHQELTLAFIALDRLGSGNDGHPFLYILLCSITLFAEGVEIKLSPGDITV